jgi:exopolysaccharide biosynthesis protein
MAARTIAWTTLAMGVDHATGSNPPESGKNNVNLLRVDLTVAHISLFATPQASLSTAGVKTTDFLTRHFTTGMVAMFAVNANYFDMSQRNVAYGLVVSQGQIVSPSTTTQPFELRISRDNAAVIVTDDSTGAQDASPWTAVAGEPYLVSAGRIVDNKPVKPIVAARTAIGVSAAGADTPPRYLYLLTIDGLEDGGPDNLLYYGATYLDTAEWLIAAGASEGFNLDGGGSTTMAAISAPNSPRLMNVPHNDEHNPAVAERAVAISFAVIVGAPT